MWILIISLVLLGVVALIAGTIRNRRLQKKIERGELDRMPEVKEVDIECCGQHERTGQSAGSRQQENRILR